MTIFLIGYMGSGKSTIGRKLSNILDYKFTDLDHYIERELAMTVEAIFAKKGEIFFRKKETELLSKIISEENTIVSLGGGTPCYGNNLDLIHSNPNAVTIYLKSSIPELTTRLFNDRSKRPLIAYIDNKDALIEFIGKHLFERAPFYEQANMVISTDEKESREVVEQIILSLF